VTEGEVRKCYHHSHDSTSFLIDKSSLNDNSQGVTEAGIGHVNKWKTVVNVPIPATTGRVHINGRIAQVVERRPLGRDIRFESEP
jgi:hypothetical protein